LDSICYVDLCDTGAVAVFGDKLLYHLACEVRTLSKNATVGERIRFYRMKRNLYSHTLAELVGTSRYAIMYYENEKTEPPLDDLKKIAAVLDIEADKLFDDYYRFLDYPYSARIRQLRKEMKLSQGDFGAMLGVGKVAVQRWEQGKTVITRQSWEKLQHLKLL